MTILNISSGWKILIVISIHFLINLITAFIFFLDDYSIPNQIVHSVIHITSFLIILNWIYYKDDSLRLSSKFEKYFVIFFLVLNLIPFWQGLQLANSGFVPKWAQFPQINFGIPNTYLRIFNSTVYELDQIVSNPLLHLNLLFANLYLLSVLIIILIFIKKNMRN